MSSDDPVNPATGLSSRDELTLLGLLVAVVGGITAWFAELPFLAAVWLADHQVLATSELRWGFTARADTKAVNVGLDTPRLLILVTIGMLAASLGMHRFSNRKRKEKK